MGFYVGGGSGDRPRGSGEPDYGASQKRRWVRIFPMTPGYSKRTVRHGIGSPATSSISVDLTVRIRSKETRA